MRVSYLIYILQGSVLPVNTYEGVLFYIYTLYIYIYIYILQGSVLPVNTCEGVSCRPGRECTQLTNGENECVCMARCPDHWKPVRKEDDWSVPCLLLTNRETEWGQMINGEC